MSKLDNMTRAGFVRLSELMIRILDAADDGEKTQVMKLADHLCEDSVDFIALAYQKAKITPEELEAYSQTNSRQEAIEEMVKAASTAAQRRTVAG